VYAWDSFLLFSTVPTDSQPLSLAGLRIKNFITHEIFKKEGDKVREPSYSKSVQTFDSPTKTIVESRILTAFGDRGRSVQMDVEFHGKDTTFQDIVSLIRCDARAFPKATKPIVKKLAEILYANIPGGLVFIFDGDLPGGKQFIGVMKAEKSDGFARKSRAGALGINSLSEIFLGKTQKLNRAALIVEHKPTHSSDDLRNPDDFTVLVFDESLQQTGTGDPREYFYKKFLGCTPLETATKQTTQIFEETMRFLGKQEITESEKSVLENTFLSYMLSPSGDLNVATFASQMGERADSYEAYMASVGIPKISVTKEVDEFLSRKLAVRKFGWEGIKVNVACDFFDNRLALTETDDEIVIRIRKSQQSLEPQKEQATNGEAIST
jgi:hypothetical protein